MVRELADGLAERLGFCESDAWVRSERKGIVWVERDGEGIHLSDVLYGNDGGGCEIEGRNGERISLAIYNKGQNGCDNAVEIPEIWITKAKFGTRTR